MIRKLVSTEAVCCPEGHVLVFPHPIRNHTALLSGLPRNGPAPISPLQLEPAELLALIAALKHQDLEPTPAHGSKFRGRASKVRGGIWCVTTFDDGEVTVLSLQQPGFAPSVFMLDEQHRDKLVELPTASGSAASA